MPGPGVEKVANLGAEVGEAVTVMGGARLLIDGIGARLDAGIAAAIANGATEAELAPLENFSVDLDNASKSLAASVAANTVAAGEPPPVEPPPVG